MTVDRPGEMDTALFTSPGPASGMPNRSSGRAYIPTVVLFESREHLIDSFPLIHLFGFLPEAWSIADNRQYRMAAMEAVRSSNRSRDGRDRKDSADGSKKGQHRWIPD